MKRSALLEMTAAEIDRYARAVGVDTSKLRKKEAKADAIEEARARMADVDVLGMACAVPIKRMRDKRVTDLIQKERMSDAEVVGLMRSILGDEQYEAVAERATDEDGTVDNDALGTAFAQLTGSEKLKNY